MHYHLPSALRVYLGQVSVAVLLLPLVGALLALPGALPALALRRRIDAPGAAVLPLSLWLSVGVVGVLSGMAHVLHWSLTIVAVTYLGAAAIAAVALVGRRDWQGLRLERQALMLAAGVGLLSLLEGAWLSGDAPYHLAAVRSLLAFNRPVVTDPYYGIANAPIDAVSGSWHTMLALASRFAHLDILTLWAPVTTLAAVALALSFWTLAREISRSETAASLATIGMLLAMFAADFRAMAYPGYASRGLLFLALYAMVRAIAAPGWASATAVAVLAAAALSVHMATAEAFAIGTALLIVATLAGVVLGRLREDGSGEALLMLSGAVAAGSAAVAPQVLGRIAPIRNLDLAPAGFELWRRYAEPLPGVLFRRPEWFWTHDFGSLGALVAVTLGVVTLGVFAFMLGEAFASRSRAAWAIVGVALLPIALETPLLSLAVAARSEYMLVRLADVVDSVAFVSLAWAVSRMRREEPSSRTPAHPFAFGVAGLALAFAAAMPATVGVFVETRAFGRTVGNPTIAQMWQGDKRAYWGGGTLEQLASIVGTTYPRIGTDFPTGYHMLAFAPFSLAAGHPIHSPYFIETTDGDRRRRAMADLVAPGTPQSERLRLIREYGIDLLAVSNATPRYGEVIASLEAQRDTFDEVLTSRHLWVFRPKVR